MAEADLQFFQEHMEEEVPVPGASSWVKMCCMELGHLTYTAYRRRLPVRFPPCRTCCVVARQLCSCRQALTCSLQHALRLMLVSLRHSYAPVQMSAVPQSTEALLQHGPVGAKDALISTPLAVLVGGAFISKHLAEMPLSPSCSTAALSTRASPLLMTPLLRNSWIST